MYTLFDHPRDFPNHYVLRPFVIGSGPEPIPAPIAGLYDTADEAREDAIGLGASGYFSPSEGEDPVIMETWM